MLALEFILLLTRLIFGYIKYQNVHLSLQTILNFIIHATNSLLNFSDWRFNVPLILFVPYVQNLALVPILFVYYPIIQSLLRQPPQIYQVLNLLYTYVLLKAAYMSYQWWQCHDCFLIHLFSLCVLFSQHSSCDNTLENCFFQLSFYSRSFVRIIYEKTKGQVPLGPLLGKQNIQAKEVYCLEGLDHYTFLGNV